MAFAKLVFNLTLGDRQWPAKSASMVMTGTSLATPFKAASMFLDFALKQSNRQSTTFRKYEKFIGLMSVMDTYCLTICF